MCPRISISGCVCRFLLEGPTVGQFVSYTVWLSFFISFSVFLSFNKFLPVSSSVCLYVFMSVCFSDRLSFYLSFALSFFFLSICPFPLSFLLSSLCKRNSMFWLKNEKSLRFVKRARIEGIRL